jgi:hypothetical protein
MDILKPHIPREYELAQRELHQMDIRVNRMKYMMDLGYYCPAYSDKEWEKFKEVQTLLRNVHPNPQYHSKFVNQVAEALYGKKFAELNLTKQNYICSVYDRRECDERK